MSEAKQRQLERFVIRMLPPAEAREWFLSRYPNPWPRAQQGFCCGLRHYPTTLQCTRGEGHSGVHVAHALNDNGRDQVLEVWE